MTTTLIAALVVGLLAPMARALVWGVPFGLLSISTVLVSFTGSALTVLLIGVMVGFLLRATTLTPDQIDTMAGGFGAVGGFVLLLSSARRMRHVRGLSVLCQRLAEEDAQATALRALGRLLDRVKKSDADRHIALVLMATGPLTQASLWEEARAGLSSIDEQSLTPSQSVLRNQALATCQLQFDELGAAENAIERIPRPAEPSIEVWLVAMEALLLAVRGQPEAARAKLRGQDTSDNPSLEASHRLVRAHILAGQNQRGAALEELKTLHRAAGRAGLERALHPNGPASALARELIDDAEETPRVSPV
ncbi:MAG: hypothetical protein OEM15_01935 [Myxococcales bacterium]|nr:hypothetical protein [Myxococcales bacterium]MDH3482627.1 hypothetical protein [Myxococcales bacterium]